MLTIVCLLIVSCREADNLDNSRENKDMALESVDTTVFNRKKDDQSTIKVDMSFDEAQSILAKYKAKPTVMQIAYPDPSTNSRIEIYLLSDERTVELFLQRRGKESPWIVKSIKELVCRKPCKKNARTWEQLPTLKMGSSKQNVAPDPDSAVPHSDR